MIRLTLLIYSIVFLAGCANSNSDSTVAGPDDSTRAARHAQTLPAIQADDAKVVSAEVPRTLVDNEWAPEKVTLTCGLKTCPPQIGALIFAVPSTGKLFEIFRCTAFLIDVDKIMTNGHCDMSDTAQGYFVTRTDNPQKTIRKISARIFKAFTPNPKNPENLSGRPDVTIYQLESAIAGIQPLRLARGAPRIYTTLTAFVIDAAPKAKDEFTMVIGQLNCSIHRNEAEFPFDLSEGPDVITAYGCGGVKGNSGSPLFAENSWDVEAILEGTKDLPALTKAKRDADGRALFPYESHPSIEASNIRCLSYPSAPDKPCVVADHIEISRRFNALLETSLDNLERASDPTSGTYSTGFAAHLIQLKSALPSPQQEVEMFYFPNCSQNSSLTSVDFPTEHLRMDFDEWGVPHMTSLKIEQSVGAVALRAGNSVKVNVKWAPPMGFYRDPKNDIPAQLGTTFSVALPPCTS